MAITVREEVNAVKTAVNAGEHDQSMDGLESQHLTVEKLKYFLPKNSRVQVTQSTVTWINEYIASSGCHKELMEERLLTYLTLLGPGVGIKQLLNAIQFVTLSVTPGMTQTKAYMITFPEKANELIAKGQDGSSFATQYAKTRLVQEIMTNTQIGFHVTYAPLQHQLVQKLLDLSNGNAANGDSASPTVQLNATLGLMEVIKTPVEQTINLKTGADDESKELQQNIAEQLSRMAAAQEAQIKSGGSIEEVQKLKIEFSDAEVVD